MAMHHLRQSCVRMEPWPLCPVSVAAGRAIPLAGDELAPLEMCTAFGKAQGSPVVYQKLPAWPFWFFNRDLYRICRFLSTQVRVAAWQQPKVSPLGRFWFPVIRHCFFC